MYTILIKNDNTAIAVERERIMQKSSLVNTLRFLVPKVYNDINMAELDFVMEYLSPVSHTVRLVTLKLVDENYKDDYLLYMLPVDIDMTAESGSVAFNLSFMNVFMDEDGVTRNVVRKIEEMKIEVIPIGSWFTLPEEAYDTLTQYYLANQQNIKALSDLIGIINQNKADSIKLDIEDGSLYATSNGNKVGQSISLEELGNELAERTTEGLVKMNK